MLWTHVVVEFSFLLLLFSIVIQKAQGNSFQHGPANNVDFMVHVCHWSIMNLSIFCRLRQKQKVQKKELYWQKKWQKIRQLL